MDDFSIISNEEQIDTDLPVEEVKRKKKLSKGKIIFISIASFVVVLLLLIWCVIGMPMPGTMATCEQHVGKSYAYTYPGDVVDEWNIPRFALTEDGKVCSGYFEGCGYSCRKPTVRIMLTPLNFDLLLPERLQLTKSSDGTSFASNVRKEYSSAWLHIDTENEDLQFTVYILVGDGLMILNCSILPWHQQGEWRVTNVSILDYHGDIQAFYDYVGE